MSVRTKCWGVAVLVLAACGALAGCASPFPNETAELSEQDSAAAVRIKGALIEEMEMAGTAIDVQFEKGTATLSGFVETEEEREQAAVIAMEQDFVGDVANDIVVK